MSTEEYIRAAAKRKRWIKYYMLHRPVSIGTQPQKGFMDFINYANKANINGISAWAEVYYDRLLDQEELDKYNEDNLTLYKLLPTDCYTLPNSISFDGEVSALLDIKFNKKTGDLSTSEEYMLPIIVSVDDRKAELIWLVVNIYDRNISRSVKQFDFYNANQDITTLLTINKEEECLDCKSGCANKIVDCQLSIVNYLVI